MILRTVHIPFLYGDLPSGERERLQYCDLCLHCLQDMVDTCVLLIDTKGIMRSEINRILSTWPDKYGKRAREIIKKLDRHNRFVEVRERADQAQSIAFKYEACRTGVGIAEEGDADAVFVPDSCPCPRDCRTLPKAVSPL